MFKGRGFTLIELLVTVSIIAILSAIGLVVYSNVIKQGQDSKRQSDLRSIQSALEQYYSDQGFYPAGNLPFGSSLNNCTGNPTSPCSSTKTYINNVPNDSNVSTPYRYEAIRNGSIGCTNVTTATQCNSYCLTSKLDIPLSPVPSLPTGCSYSSGYNFFVSPP
ncbi:MAG: type II secretion system protein [Candidatus Daviesbacteria bacterium]|nr:type II secretion system protein [Candidatus Daviesbacteria bacterium]